MDELMLDKKHAMELAKAGKCEADCGEHIGLVQAVHVMAPKHFFGFDWGWYSLCEYAREEHTGRGLIVSTE